MYRKRIKKSKLVPFSDIMKFFINKEREVLGRKLTQRETQYLKRWIYGQRKKTMKGYGPTKMDQIMEKYYYQSSLGRGLINPTITFF